MTIFGALVYASIVGRVTVMLNSLAQAGERFRLHMAQVNQFMQAYELPPTIRRRIRKHFKFEWDLSSGTDVNALMRELPFSMQVAVRRHILLDSLQRIPLMQRCSEAVVTALCMDLNVRQCLLGEQVIREGDPCTEMYFLKSGRLRVWKSDKILGTLSDGAIFGEVGLLLGKLRTATVVAESRSIYFALKKADYIKIMHLYPEFHEILKSRAAARAQQRVESMRGQHNSERNGEFSVSEKHESQPKVDEAKCTNPVDESSIRISKMAHKMERARAHTAEVMIENLISAKHPSSFHARQDSSKVLTESEISAAFHEKSTMGLVMDCLGELTREVKALRIASTSGKQNAEAAKI